MSACVTETAENTPSKTPTPKTETEAKNQTIQTANANYHLFHSKARPYSMQIPVEWLIKEHTKSGALTVKAPEKPDTLDYRATIQLNIRKTRLAYSEESKQMEPKPMELQEALDKYMEGLQRSYDEMQVEGIDDTKVGGEIAKVATYTYLKKSEFVNQVKAKTFLFHRDSETYILNFKEEVSNFEAMQPIFEEIKNSFRF